MARIRSIHPGLSTDEAYMAMSPLAKAAWPLLWTECDDHGVFEWKPLVLKARLLPADQVDFTELLGEWTRLASVHPFDHDGHRYGVVRNFCRFQRPKKPAYRFTLPDSFRTFAGLTTDSTEPVPHQFPTEGEKSPQMKDVGGRRKEEEKSLEEAAPPEKPVVSKASKGTRIPEDYVPDYGEALTLGLSLTEAIREAANFKDYWKAKPGAGGVKLDWEATWRVWCRKASDDRRTGSGAPTQPTTPSAAQTIWINEDDPRWSALVTRYAIEHDRPPRAAGSRYQTGIGFNFPADWVPAKSSVAA